MSMRRWDASSPRTAMPRARPTRRWRSRVTTAQPVANAARNTWVTATALSTALNTSYMAEQLALFGIVVGIALLLSGIGFAVLAVGGTLRNPDPALKIFGRKSSKTARATPVPTA